MGRTAATVEVEGYDSDIIVTGGNTTKNDVEQIHIKTAQGTYIEAGQIIDIKKASALSSLPRYKGDYALTITADYDLEYDKNEILSDIKDKIDELDLGEAKIEYGGEDALIRENFGQIGVLGAVALAIVFMILMVQFKSFTMPLLIFITIPLSAIGSIAGLYVTGQPISFTALLGIVSLLGIVVNNAIILIDYINKETANGIPIKKACLNASQRRLRPILLSTTTTVIGLIPLAVSNSQLFKPMAIALMSGLLVSTLLTLVVLPVFVSIVKKDTVSIG
jgi:multidrug efflux pump subunit AcrB